MKVAALYDIHGNLPALEAVLEDIRQESVDQIVVGGDLFPGPMSNEALELLLGLDLPVRFLRGNGDRAVLEFAAGKESDTVPETYRGMMRWIAQHLGPEHHRAIISWPESIRIEILAQGEVLFCHATPSSDTKIFTRRTPEDRLLPIFENQGTALVVCGHTHMQFDRRVGSVRVVNAGSVGMPFGDPGAYWLLLGPEVDLRKTRYNLMAAAERIRSTDYPQAQKFADENVLGPPSEEKMLELFAGSELK